MKSSSYAIQIIPDLTIDDKYASIIEQALSRLGSFTSNALRDNRVRELFLLDKSRIDEVGAARILNQKGRLVVGFQFEISKDTPEDIFRIYAKKVTDGGKPVKFYLTPTVQQIMLQLVSLEDRRTVAVFSMLNSSMEVGYRILSTLYGNQLRRLVTRSPSFMRPIMQRKLDKLAVAKPGGDSELWKDSEDSAGAASGALVEQRTGSQDNILQVLADDGTFDEINQYVSHIISKSDHIREKWLMLQENPAMPRGEIYEQMVREDLDHLENCYARIHVYLKAFYKNKDRRMPGQNRVLRQFFANQIERITGETGLLEDLLRLNQDEYFKNIARHREL
jgi:hypothetical protein